MRPRIQVRNLGKRYALRGAAQTTLRDVATATLGRLLRRRGQHDSAYGRGQSHFWAVKDVSFDVDAGEVVGIIGRNGAGKSTLLKLLSRITEPTAGEAVVRGRLGSLLEVGTGFHPELSGRENIFLSGAILGMRRHEIRRRLSEIVEFAEIGRFLDMPAKHYSSGMYVRLAFAVAAHLEPEVLVVDEVLAVGDAAFQRKCMGKMGDVARSGRTILFVSHNMAAVRSLCDRCILLDAGRVVLDSHPSEGIATYLMTGSGTSGAVVDTRTMPRPSNIDPDSPLRIEQVTLLSESSTNVLALDAPLGVEIRFRCTAPLRNVAWGFYVEGLDGVRLLDLKSAHSRPPAPALGPGLYVVSGQVMSNPLAPGTYRLGLGARDESRGLDWLPNVMVFSIEDTTEYQSLWFEKTAGMFRAASVWSEAEAIGEHSPTERAPS